MLLVQRLLVSSQVVQRLLVQRLPVSGGAKGAGVTAGRTLRLLVQRRGAPGVCWCNGGAHLASRSARARWEAETHSRKAGADATSTTQPRSAAMAKPCRFACAVRLFDHGASLTTAPL